MDSSRFNDFKILILFSYSIHIHSLFLLLALDKVLASSALVIGGARYVSDWPQIPCFSTFLRISSRRA